MMDVLRTKLFLFFILLVTVNVSADIYYTEEEALREVFPDAEKIEKKTKSLNKEQKEKIRVLLGISNVYNEFTYSEILKGNETIGYALTSGAMGKKMHFTFMVVVNPNGAIAVVKILEYKEKFGRRVREESFLNKFKEKTINSPLRMNSDIDAVTGATISSKALIDGVRKCLIYLNVLVLT